MRRYRNPVLGFIALILIAVLLYGWLEALSDPIVRRGRITLVGADPNLSPLRIALVSDIHAGNLAMPAWRLNRIVDQINAQKPDVVLIAGDFVNGTGSDSWDFHPRDIVAPLSRLRAPLGVIAVLGNHDIDTSQPQVEAALHDARVTVLHNRAMRLGPIALIGMDMDRVNPADIDPVIASARRMGGFPVLMIHPPPFNGVIPASVPVILAGHSHCGQVVLPGWDNSFDVLSGKWRFPPRLRCGMVQIWHHTTVVGAGVGASTIPPIRLNAPPDFWMLTLKGAPLPAVNARSDRQIRQGSSH